MHKTFLERLAYIIIFVGFFVIFAVPLIMNSGFFFPFIYPKALVFRVAVQVMFMAYLYLAYRRAEYRFTWSPLFYLLLAFVGVNFISSLMSVNFYLSFWGNIERSEGLITYLYLLALFIMLIGIVKSTKDWYLVFDFWLLISIPIFAIAFGQALQLDFITNTAGARVTSTIGNAAFLATYSLFTIFFAGFMLTVRHKRWLKFYYSLLIIAGVIIIFLTGTRGTVIGLAAGLLFATVIIVWFGKNVALKRSLGIATLVVIGLFLFLQVSKDVPWMKNAPIVVKRFSDISFTTRTAQTRFWTWDSAWQGWKDKFWLGHGLEHFNISFDKYFNPLIYEDEGSVVWFDRAHNVIFDRGVTSGIIGLLVYLALLFYPLYWLLKYYKTHPSSHWSLILSTLLVAYFVQNLFVFDTLVSYLPWLLSLGFVHFFWFTHRTEVKSLLTKSQFGLLFLISLVSFLPIMYTVNIKVARANLETFKAMQASSEGDARQAYNHFVTALDYNTYGNQEYRIQFIEFVEALNRQFRDNPNDFVLSAVARADKELKKQIEEDPRGRNYLLYLRYYLTTSNIGSDRLQTMLDAGSSAIAVSPTRPHIYYELGFAHIILGRDFLMNNEPELAHKQFQAAERNFQKAIDLNPEVIESHLKMIQLFMASGESERAAEYLSMMESTGIDYHSERFLVAMANDAVLYDRFEWAARFYENLITLTPENSDYYIRASLAYAEIGNIERAIALAETVKNKFPSLVSEADSFIQQLETGKFQTTK